MAHATVITEQDQNILNKVTLLKQIDWSHIPEANTMFQIVAPLQADALQKLPRDYLLQ